LPGLVCLVALALIWNDLHAQWPVFPGLPPIDGEEQNLLVLAGPTSMLLGLLSNILVFMGVNDVLIRYPARRRAPDLFRLHDWLVKRIRLECWRTLACADTTLTQHFMANADAELLILNRIGVTRRSPFLRPSPTTPALGKPRSTYTKYLQLLLDHPTVG
jgi:hypothetical protein